MNIEIDHVTIAGLELKRMEAAFESVGLKTDYGGPHSNQVTHMSLLGFDDGSYIELISTIEAGQASTWWRGHIAEDGGPCAWCARVDGLKQETERLLDLGIPVEGPNFMFRERTDGKRVEWELAFPSEFPKGAVLPFLIEDHGPREYRVSPSASVEGGCLTGVAAVLIGVESIAEIASLFQQVYEFDVPSIEEDMTDGVRRAWFEGTPVILEEPLEMDSALGKRLEKFGPCPTGFLIGTRSMDEAQKQYQLLPSPFWFGRQLAWFNPSRIDNIRLGVVET